MKILITIILALSFGYCHCQSTPFNIDNALSRQFEIFKAAVIRQDTTSLSNLYWNDAVSLVANVPALEGKEKILQRWNKAFRMPFQLQLSLLGNKMGLDYSLLYGTFKIQSAANEIIASGKWSQFWKKENNTWKIESEMDNFDAKK